MSGVRSVGWGKRIEKKKEKEHEQTKKLTKQFIRENLHWVILKRQKDIKK